MPDTYAPMVLCHTAISAMVVIFTQICSTFASSNSGYLAYMLESFITYAFAGLFFGFLYAVTSSIVTLIAYRQSTNVEGVLKAKFLSNLKSFSCIEMGPSAVAKLFQTANKTQECASSKNDSTDAKDRDDVKPNATEDGSGDVKPNATEDGSGDVKPNATEDGSGDVKQDTLENNSDDVKPNTTDAFSSSEPQSPAASERNATPDSACVEGKKEDDAMSGASTV